MSLLKPYRSRIAVGVAVVIVLAIVGGVVWGFGQQLVLARQMRLEETRLEQEVAAEEARHDELTEQLEYVKSDEYVEQWAREEAKMAKPKEVVVVVLTDSGGEAAVEAQPTPAPQPQSRPFWVELWELVFAPSGR